jgi:uncharacterized membrane protein YfcA
MEFQAYQIIIALLASILVGFSKTGVPSSGIFVVAIMAMIFPAKQSVGILLPMLITADIVAVTYYRRTVIWKHLISLIPWVLAGILLGFFVLGKIQDYQLSLLIGIIVLVLIALHLGKDRLEQKIQFRFTHSAAFHAVLGILAGFTTMVGNAAGAIMAIYLLGKGLQKKEFIGTGAWFFLTVNLIKVPFSVYLGLITTDTLVFNIWMIPGILAGTFIGIKVLPLIPQKYFQLIILAFAALGAFQLIFNYQF